MSTKKRKTYSREFKLILQKPKNGREHELVFIPQKEADRLPDIVYICLNAV